MTVRPAPRRGLRASLLALGVVVAVLAMHGPSLHHLEHLGQADHAGQHEAASPADPDTLRGVDVACTAGSCVALLVGGLSLLVVRRRGALRAPRGDDGALSGSVRVVMGTAARPPPVARLHLVLSVQRC